MMYSNIGLSFRETLPLKGQWHDNCVKQANKLHIYKSLRKFADSLVLKQNSTSFVNLFRKLYSIDTKLEKS